MRRTTSIFKAPSVKPPTTTNHDGFAAYERDIYEQYIQILVSNTFGNTFYVDQKGMIEQAQHVHDAMLAKDPEFAAKALVYARQQGFMRTQPIYGLAKLALLPKPHFENAFSGVIRTPKDLADFFTILKSLKGNLGGRRIKTTVAGKWLRDHINEYWAIKYGTENAPGEFTLKDLARITHAKGGHHTLLDYVARDDDKKYEIPAALPKILAFERLKRATTVAEKIAAITEGKIPHEQATPFAGKDGEVWKAIVPNMPIFALLKNLATIERMGIMNAVRDHVVATFTNEKAVGKSMVLPYRFFEAMKHVNDPKVRDALRDAMDLAFVNVPVIGGKTAVLLDCSPSMKPGYRSDDMMDIAATFAVAAMKKAEDGTLVCFDNEAEIVPVSKRDSLLTQAQTIAKWVKTGGTNHAIALHTLGKQKVDSLIVITDGQQNQNTVGTFAEKLDWYRRNVNKKVKVIILDVTAYGHSITPDDKDTMYVYGWSDAALRVAAMQAQGWDTLVKAVRADTVTTGEAQSE